MPIRPRAQRRCLACERLVAVRFSAQNLSRDKQRSPHKCNHGHWCIAGILRNNWEPGDARHANVCAECAKDANIRKQEEEAEAKLYGTHESAIAESS